MKFPRTVYAIQHNETKRIYVGSSARVKERYWNHIYQLRNHKHKNEDMQSDFDSYGENYSLFIIDEINEWSEKNKEYEWMIKLQSHIRGSGYNYKDHSCKSNSRSYKLPIKSGVPIPKEG